MIDITAWRTIFWFLVGKQTYQTSILLCNVKYSGETEAYQFLADLVLVKLNNYD